MTKRPTLTARPLCAKRKWFVPEEAAFELQIGAASGRGLENTGARLHHTMIIPAQTTDVLHTCEITAPGVRVQPEQCPQCGPSENLGRDAMNKMELRVTAFLTALPLSL